MSAPDAPELLPPSPVEPPPPPCGIGSMPMAECVHCHQWLGVDELESHDERHTTSLVESYNQRLAVEFVPAALAEWLLPGICDIIAAYAATTRDTCTRLEQREFYALLSPPVPSAAMPLVELKRTRFEDHKICMKVSDGQLLAAMRVITQFGHHIETHAEFANEFYLRKCLSLYIKFLTLQNKLAVAAATAAGINSAVQLVPNAAVDVWWSSHLLRPSQYSKFCMRKFGRLIDRKSLIHTNPLSSDQKQTAALWQKEYNEPYAVPNPNPTATAGVTAVSENELKAFESDGLVPLTAVVMDRRWLPDFRTYAKASGPDDPKLAGKLHHCKLNHPLTLYRAGIVPPSAGYVIGGSFDCDGCRTTGLPLAGHYYHCDACGNYDLCQRCIRQATGVACPAGSHTARVVTKPAEPPKTDGVFYKSFNCLNCSVLDQSWASDYGVCSHADCGRRVCEMCANANEYAALCLLGFKRFWFFCWLFPQSALHFAPSHPIDWVWHSAMLYPALYQADCRAVFGSLLDHTPWPTVSADQVSGRAEQLQAVDRMWMETFNQKMM